MEKESRPVNIAISLVEWSYVPWRKELVVVKLKLEIGLSWLEKSNIFTVF